MRYSTIILPAIQRNRTVYVYTVLFFFAIIYEKGGVFMDFSSIGSLIGTVGFPIACCVYLIYVNNKNEEKHTEEVEKLRVTVENNTKVMLKLCNKLGVDYGE